MYLVIWKYIVEFENKVKFEYEYDQGGTWNSFFRKSEKYCGSHLILFDKNTGTYLLIDIWNDKESYENFLMKNKKVYDKLCNQLFHLYKIEQKIKTL